MKVKAVFNAVIVRPLEEDENQYGGIVVPDMGKEKNKKGTIVSIGPGYTSFNGNFIPTTLSEGDIVILPSMGFTSFTHEGDEYYVGKENDIIGVLEK